jgi:hypothetical protein
MDKIVSVSFGAAKGGKILDDGRTSEPVAIIIRRTDKNGTHVTLHQGSDVEHTRGAAALKVALRLMTVTQFLSLQEKVFSDLGYDMTALIDAEIGEG